jgi:phage shock protein A
MENIEGRVEAFDLGHKKDLRQELSSLENQESIDAALADLKKRVGSAGADGQKS